MEKTSRELKTHVAGHCRTIRCKNLNDPLAVHFVEHMNSTASLRYIVIEKVSLPRRGGDLDQPLLREKPIGYTD